MLYTKDGMGYYMRLVGTDTRRVTARGPRDALVALDPGYVIAVDNSVVMIHHSGATIAQVEINVPGDGLFEDERDELVEFATDADGEDSAKARVLDTLRAVRTIVAAQVLFGTGDAEATLRRLDPLWAWLFQNQEGCFRQTARGITTPVVSSFTPSDTRTFRSSDEAPYPVRRTSNRSASVTTGLIWTESRRQPRLGRAQITFGSLAAFAFSRAVELDPR